MNNTATTSNFSSAFFSVMPTTLAANRSFDEPPDKPPTDGIIGHFLKPSVIVVGFASNVAAAALLLHAGSRLRKSAVGHLLAAVCISDAIFMATSLPIWVSDVFKLSKADLYNRDGMCQFLTLLSSASCFLSTWYMVSLAIERFISVSWRRVKLPPPAPPPSASAWRSPQSNSPSAVCGTLTARVVIITLGILSTCIFLNISVNVGIDRNEDGQTLQCRPYSNTGAALSILGNIDLFVNAFVPHAAVVALYCVTFFRLASIRRRTGGAPVSSVVGQTDAAESGVDSSLVGDQIVYPQLQPAELRLTKLSVWLSVVVIALQFPQHVDRVVYFFVQVPSEFILYLHFLYQVSFAVPFFIIIALHAGIRRKLSTSLVKAFAGEPDGCCCRCKRE